VTTPAAARAVVISLRPRFARAILESRKSVELRRHRVAAPAGSQLILYASSPTMAVLGTATLARVDTSTAADIWRRYRDHLSLTQREFDAYLDGAAHASALVLEHPHTLPTPLTLAALRASSPFQPPQSYRYLTPNDPQPLHTLPSQQHPASALRHRSDSTYHDLAEATGLTAAASPWEEWLSTQTAPSYHELMAITGSSADRRTTSGPASGSKLPKPGSSRGFPGRPIPS